MPEDHHQFVEPRHGGRFHDVLEDGTPAQLHLDWSTGPYYRSPSDPPWQPRMRQLGPCALGGLFDDVGAQVGIAKLPA
jgi:hypothetical protein